MQLDRTGKGNFPWKSSTCPGSSTSSNPEHETDTRANACARTSGTRKVVGRCLVYRGGGSRIERRATASHWPPIGRSGGGSLQSSIQAVIG